MVGWIVFTWDVSSCDAENVLSRLKERVDMFEDGVDGAVVVPPGVPSFNDAGVVSMQYDVPGFEKIVVDSADKELKTNGFSPSDVFLSV